MGDIVRIGSGPLRCALIALVAATLMTPAPAHAAKGWAFKETFGSANEPKFIDDRNMAVDRSSGDLLVIDAEAETLSRWHSDGTPSNFPALGTNVIDGKKGPGGKPCAEELASCDETPSGKVLGWIRDQVAVDNSGTATDGNIYLTSFFDGPVDIFSEEGEFLGRLSRCDSGLLFDQTEGVGVDEEGSVYVSAADKGIHKFEPSANPPVNTDCAASLSIPVPGNLAVGVGPTDGHVFVVRSSAPGIRKLDSDLTEVEYEFFGNGLGRRLTLDPITGHLFHKEGENEKGWVEYDASGPTADSAEVISRRKDAGGAVGGLAVAEGAEELYVSRAGTETIEVWEAVLIPTGVVGPPAPVSGAGATATGTVDPEGVGVTECFFKYGPTTAYGEEADCEEYESGGVWQDLISPSELGTGTEPIPVRAEINGLLANGATHHYQLIARSADGEGESEDEEFQTADTFFTDPASDVSETEATLNGTVKLEGVALTECSFEWGETTEYGQSAPCDQAPGSIPTDDAEHAVTATIDGLDPSTVYHFRLVAENALGQILAEDRAFGTRGPPGIDVQVASALGQSTATLQAQVNPFGSATGYHFEWGPTASYGNRVPATGELPAGSSDQPVVIGAELEGLQPATEYHFRVVASNAFGPTEGADHAFETLNEHGLPDNRAFELITPFDKGPSGSLVQGINMGVFPQASEDGECFIWPLQNGMPESTAGGWARWLACRDEGKGWFSAQLSAPSLIPAPGIPGLGFIHPSVVLYASDNQRCGLVETYNPITADTPPGSEELGVFNLYLWREDSGEIAYRPSENEIAYRPAQEGEVGYQLVSNRLPLNPEGPLSNIHFTQIEAAGDCSRVYFKSSYELIDGASGLYEWEEGTLRDAGVGPDETVGPEMGSAGAAVPGGEISTGSTARWNAVSPDGKRLFFTAIGSSGKPAIFMRENGGASVVEISRSETAVPTNGARFETASPDGSKVFFRANYGIDAEKSSAGATGESCGPLGGETSNDTIPPIEAKRCDLYLYDMGDEELSDLSADTADPQGAQIQGAVAVDEDGSHAYFAALGQLVAGKGRTYAQNIAGDSANVYLAHPGGLSYVATLRAGNRDLFFGATMRTNNVDFWSAETSADGTRLLFESAAGQTAYDSGGAKMAYLYDAGTGKIACVSCPPDGGPTLSEPDWRVLGGPVSRSLSENGDRAFFTSPDVLISDAQAGEGERNVYEWEEGQVYFLAIAERAGKDSILAELASYHDSSATGDSAFLSTNQQLAPQDRDFISDIYSARVDGGIPKPPKPPECQVDEGVPLLPNQIYCQGERAPQPSPGASSSCSGASCENVKQQECPKGKLRRGKRCLTERQIAKQRCRKVEGKEAKTRCVRRQLRLLNQGSNGRRGGVR